MNAPSRHEHAHLRTAGHGLADSFEQALDPYGTTTPLLRAQWAWLTHPRRLVHEMAEAGFAWQRLALHGTLRALGLPHEDPLPAGADDERFRDAVWTEHPAWDGLKEIYLLFARQAEHLAERAPGLAPFERRRARFWTRKWLAAASPTNQFWTNPVAQRKAMESGGLTLWHGWANFVDDLRAGTLRLASTEGFAIGENLATTPGAVVRRNRLLEVIHYKPTQPKVHAVPVVIVTPWINKFYVLDLSPQRSMVRWLLDQGVDVYITSWKNADSSMADVRFDDYLTEGIGTIVETARELSGSPQVHAVGYCIGGIALSAWMAWAQRAHAPAKMPVRDWTLFVTMVDFRAPGDIEAFLGATSIDALEHKMKRRGYLDGHEMTAAFRLLRSRSLIWNYVVHGWLYGEPPPPMDVLYWNMDSTRLPATEHAWYLRQLYLHNRLVEPDALTLAGHRIDLRRITQPLYAVACEEDHIVPWREAFRIHEHVRGPRRFTLTSSGHILGIVNPPVMPPKRRFRSGAVSDTSAHDADAWRAALAEQPGSWWTDWIEWLRPRLGERRDAPPVASAAFPALAPAPGTYVRET